MLIVSELEAVQHSPDIPLQILAGPGSGKTRVLTSRIVHLISEHGIPPSAICAVTFTNKAANEMRERLTKMVGKEVVNSLKMGTFHSLCARFVRKYAKLGGIEGNFTVCDSEERCAYMRLAIMLCQFTASQQKDHNKALEAIQEEALCTRYPSHRKHCAISYLESEGQRSYPKRPIGAVSWGWLEIKGFSGRS